MQELPQGLTTDPLRMLRHPARVALRGHLSHEARDAA